MLVDRYRKPAFQFSEQEEKTGEIWLDGKPIYKKLIRATTTVQNVNVSNSFSSLGLSNIDTLWIDESSSFVKYGNNDTHYIGSQPITIFLATNDWKAVYVNVSAQNVNIRAGLPNNVAVYLEWYITLKYTKKSD